MAFLAISLTCLHTSTIIWLFKFKRTMSLFHWHLKLIFRFQKYSGINFCGFCEIYSFMDYFIYNSPFNTFMLSYIPKWIHVFANTCIDWLHEKIPPPPPKKKNGVYIYVYMLLKCTTVIKCNFFQNQTKCFVHTFLNDHFNIYLKCTLLIINI